MYKHDYNKDEDLKTVQSIKERRSSVMNTMEIEKFMKKYKDENDGFKDKEEYSSADGFFIHVYVDRKTNKPISLDYDFKKTLDTI